MQRSKLQILIWIWQSRNQALISSQYRNHAQPTSFNMSNQFIWPLNHKCSTNKILMNELTRFSSQETPYSFKAPFTIGQASCKYFSVTNKQLHTNKPKAPSKCLLHKHFELSQTKQDTKAMIVPLYWGKRVEKELTSSMPPSFQKGSNFSTFQWSIFGSSSHGFGLSCFPLCFLFTVFSMFSPITRPFTASSWQKKRKNQSKKPQLQH